MVKTFFSFLLRALAINSIYNCGACCEKPNAEKLGERANSITSIILSERKHICHKYFQRYLASNTQKMGFLNSWPGKKRLGRISSVRSYEERVATPRIAA